MSRSTGTTEHGSALLGLGQVGPESQHRSVRDGHVVRTGAYRQVVSRPKETSE